MTTATATTCYYYDMVLEISRDEMNRPVGSVTQKGQVLFSDRFGGTRTLMAYLQLWAQQYRYGNLVQGQALPRQLYDQVLMMSEG